MELLHVDFAERELPLKQGARLRRGERLKKASILVFTDHFTRYTLAYVVPDQKAQTVAKCLWERIISVLGAPAKLMSDQGKNFESKLIAELCTLHGIHKMRTTPYHPAGNGQLERAHQTITKMITGYSPHYLMFGRRPRMPVDLLFPTLPLQSEFHRVDHYVDKIYTQLQASLRDAESRSRKEADRQKRNYDHRAHATTLESILPEKKKRAFAGSANLEGWVD
jgi:transposase InsO family protein